MQHNTPRKLHLFLLKPILVSLLSCQYPSYTLPVTWETHGRVDEKPDLRFQVSRTQILTGPPAFYCKKKKKKIIYFVKFIIRDRNHAL